MNTFICMECGKETPLATGLCATCQKRHTMVEKMFQDFICRQSGTTKEKHYNSDVKHLEYPTKEEAEAAGVKVPTWKEELKRFMKELGLKKIENRRDYFHLLFRASCWRDRTFPGYVLIFATYFFNSEWLIVDWYDHGEKENKKKGIKYRRPGWRRTVYNPYEYLKWAMPGMAEWLHKMEVEHGLTRKDLVRQAEKTIEEEGGYDEEDLV